MVSADYEKSCQESICYKTKNVRANYGGFTWHIKMSQWNKSQWWQETKEHFFHVSQM